MADYDENYTRYQLRRGLARRIVRRAYLAAAASWLQGPTVDFGCGVGELLRRLPEGSVGLEINPSTVEHCQAQGLDVLLYDADADDWSLTPLGKRHGLRSLVISHVLEHLERPMEKFNLLLRACQRLGISRVLAIVPGPAGFRSDATHKTFIDRAMLSDPAIPNGTEFSLAKTRHFPINIPAVGRGFTHLELQALFERPETTEPG